MEGLEFVLDPVTRRDWIETGRVILRRARSEDLTMFHAALSDPAIMRYWATPPHQNIAESRDWVAAMIAADPAISDDFVIEAGGQPVGKLGCWRLPELGYLLHPDFHGHGFAGEALAGFIGYMRDRGLSRLKAEVDPRNAASLRLLERGGFIQTGIAPASTQVGDELCDSVYLELTLNPAA